MMDGFTPQVDRYVRRQLELEKDPWWIAGELARLAAVDPATARSYVDSRAAEVRPPIATHGYLPNLILGWAMLAVGLFILVYGFLNGRVLFPSLGLIFIGVYLSRKSRHGWRRHRLGSK